VILKWSNISDLKHWRYPKLKNSNITELELLRLKILKAVRFSKRFWIIYRDHTFGIATILNLVYKKSYIEILFYTKSDALEKGIPLLKIYTPLEEELNFDEILKNLDYDDDGFISPSKIIEKIKKLVRREFRKHLAILNHEIELIDIMYENYEIDIPYNRTIWMYFQGISINFDINFEKYPILPTFYFSKTLSNIITEREFKEESIIKTWDIKNPLHIYEIIDYLYDLINNRLNFEPYKKNSQLLVLNNVSIKSGIQHVSFKIRRGKSIGIVYKKRDFENFENTKELMDLFSTIAGNNLDFEGDINIFGNSLHGLTEDQLKKIFILPQQYDQKIFKMKVKRAIEYDIPTKNILHKILKRFGWLDDFTKNALEVTGLLNKKNAKLSQLNALDFLLLSIGRAILQSPTLIMFSVPFNVLDRLDYEKFNNYMDLIKQKFHLILIFHAPDEVVSNCDKVLTLTEEISKIGTIDEYIEELPQSGEIITIELENPDLNMIKEIKTLENIDLIIEERRNERFKIFLKTNPDKLIVHLTRILGSSLVSFKRSQATLKEYLEFKELKPVKYLG
jgi:ABC-type Mn2+/Zn2+ transport system ATPase subunit